MLVVMVRRARRTAVGIVGAVAMSACAAVLALPAPAQACSQSDHCYSLLWNSSQVEGTWSDLLTSSNSVPGWQSGDRLQNETWTIFDNGGWVEDGDTTGTIGFNTVGQTTSTPVYFYATAPTSNVNSLFEVDLPNGPGFGNWFTATEGDAGNGVWCPAINGTQLGCTGSLPFYSSTQYSGIEAAANTPPLNTGTTFDWGEQLVTGNWIGWPSKSYAVTLGSGYCIFGVSWTYGGTPGAGAAFGTPNPNPSCLGDGVHSAAQTSGATPPPLPGTPATSALPAEDYQVPRTATLSSAALGSIVQRVAATAGDPKAATGAVTAVGTSLRQALSTVDPTTVAPTHAMGGYANWLASPTELIELHGDFKLDTAPRPPGTPAPTGHDLDVIVDTHTGWIDAYRIGGTSAKLAAAGKVHAITAR